MSPSLAAASRPDAAPTACFSLTAQNDPGVMSRVMDLFAKRGVTPIYWCSRVNGPELTIDLHVRGLDRDTVLHVAACFRQMPRVRTVLTSEKR